MQPPSNSRDERFLQLEKEASEAATTIRECISEKNPITIVTHFDADGISAGSVILSALQREGATVHLRNVENLTERVLEEVEALESELIIFSDIGSGYLSLIGNFLGTRKIVIADHHQALGTFPQGSHHFNPHLMGFDGSVEISGAGTAYLLAKSVSKENRDLAPIALVGCLGDQQDKGPRRTVSGLNKMVLQDALEEKLVEVSQDLVLFGRQTRPIHKALASTTNPFLPGLSGEEDRCLALLDAANVSIKTDDKWRTIEDLSSEEKRRVVDKIVQHITSLNAGADVALELIGTVYTLTQEDQLTPLRDGREFATLLNACGRMGKPGLGTAICIGDRGASFEEAQQVYSEYRRSLAKYMTWLSESQSILKKGRHTVIVRGEGVIDENMTGAVSSLISASSLFGDSRVVVVVTLAKDGEAKVSARGTDSLVAKGVNLGKILQDLTQKYGGNGGGHAIAAGAILEREWLEKFLDDFGNRIESLAT